MSKENITGVDFVTRAAPKGKRKGKWTTASNAIQDHLASTAIAEVVAKSDRLSGRKRSKGGKQRQQRDIIVLRKDPNIDPLKKYFYKNWDDEKGDQASIVCNKLCVPHSETVNVDGFDVYDNYNNRAHESTRNLIAFDEENGDFIFGKVAPRQSSEIMGKKRDWTTIRKAFGVVRNVKPNVGRGHGRGGKNKAYKVFGYRKDPLSSDLGEYAYKSTTKYEDKEAIEKMISELAKRMEQSSNRITKGLSESIVYQEIKKHVQIPTFSNKGHSTAFCIGTDYWSKCHTDNDYFLTSLSVLSDRSDDHDDILYYFVFPQYNAAIPIRSGEIVIFNPHIPHSCSNPRHDMASIFSAYVSAKTVLTQACITLHIDE